MLQMLLDRVRRGTARAGALVALAATPALGRARDDNDKDRNDAAGKGDKNGAKAERERQGGNDDKQDRDGDHGRGGSREERQRTRESDDERQRSRDERQANEDDGGGGDRDIVGGRVGEAAERLRRRGEKLTGADGNRNGGAHDDDIAVSFDPATNGLEIETDNIAFIRDDDGAITVDTDNIFFERAPDPEPTPFPMPGFPAPMPDGGDNDTEILS